MNGATGMSGIDWVVLIGTQVFIVAYGLWRSRQQQHDMQSYLLSGRGAGWLTVGLSIMATQASAITFLSAPGQAYADGMRFIHIYLGLPIAMVILSVTVVPLYHRLKVYTAYEFLEKRFDVKTRTLTAMLFLTQRGLAAGFTIYAPALVLQTLLGWPLFYTNLIVGTIVIFYTMTGGTKAVSQTQKQQMAVILVGMVIAGVMLVRLLPAGMGFTEALQVAGKMERLNVIDFTFDPTESYNVWTGVLGGVFLMLSYFGTDQSQVQRYLTGSSVGQSRLGLLFNGMLKIPMQFAILLVGALMYVFYLFNPVPVIFNTTELERGRNQQVRQLESEHAAAHATRQQKAEALVIALRAGQEADIEQATVALKAAEAQTEAIRGQAIAELKESLDKQEINDTNYIFLSFVRDYLPIGVVGLLISVILSASMSSTASELNALASTTVVDIYQRLIKPDGSQAHYVWASKLMTLLWGLYGIAFAMVANRIGSSLIEAVNVLGSLVYGTILGVFLTAFYLRKVGGNAVFLAAAIMELVIIGLWWYQVVPYLWLNAIGALGVLALAIPMQQLLGGEVKSHLPTEDTHR